jgi:hypothetical protein
VPLAALVGRFAVKLLSNSFGEELALLAVKIELLSRSENRLAVRVGTAELDLP